MTKTKLTWSSIAGDRTGWYSNEGPTIQFHGQSPRGWVLTFPSDQANRPRVYPDFDDANEAKRFAESFSS